MRIDVHDVGGSQAGILECEANGAGSAEPLGIRLRDVVTIGGQARTAVDAENLRTASGGELRGFEHENARALAATLAEAGLRIVTGGTDMGLMLVDLTSTGVTGDVAAKALERAGLAVNKNMIPFDPRPPEAPSGLRLSSNAGTTRGFGVPEFRKVGDWIVNVLRDPQDYAAIAATREEVLALCRAFPIY